MPTLYFLNTTSTNQFQPEFSLDGDWSGLTDLNPLGYTEFALRLTSEYNNRDILQVEEDPGFKWLFSLDLVEANERYTTFKINTTAQAEWAADKFTSGYYGFELFGTYLEISNTLDQFVEDQWDSLLTGEFKVKTETTNDMQRGQIQEIVKYTTDPNTAQSYVIYRD